MAFSMGISKVQDPHDHIPFSSTTSFTPEIDLPKPTYSPPDLKKRSHEAKKQPDGHIPQPRNAFILFRCDCVRQKKIPEKVENDHRNISRIVGQIWRQMNDEQREPWVLMADREKLAHSKVYPGYRSSTGVSNKKFKRGDDIPHDTQPKRDDDNHFWGDWDLLDLYRSSSCPPGTLHVPQANLENSNGYGAPLKTRDDMTRHPSRVTFYQSTSHQLTEEELTDINNQHYFIESIKDDYFTAVANQEYYTEEQARSTLADKDMSKDKEMEAKFCGPHINVHPYPTPGPNDPPEWDVAPTKPYTWTDWSAFQADPSSASSGTFGTNINAPFFIDSFLSSLPPLPRHSSDSDDTFPSFDHSLKSSFTALETEGPSTHSPSEVTDAAPPGDVQNITEINNDSSENSIKKSSISDLAAADSQRALDYEWNTGFEFNAPATDT